MKYKILTFLIYVVLFFFSLLEWKMVFNCYTVYCFSHKSFKTHTQPEILVDTHWLLLFCSPSYNVSTEINYIFQPCPTWRPLQIQGNFIPHFQDAQLPAPQIGHLHYILPKNRKASLYLIWFIFRFSLFKHKGWLHLVKFHVCNLTCGLSVYFGVFK